MRRFVVHAGWVFIGSLLILCVGAIQGGVHYARKDNSKIASVVSCQLQSIEADDEIIKLKLRCGERSAYVKRPKEVAAVLNNIGPLTCTLFRSGRAECTRTAN